MTPSRSACCCCSSPSAASTERRPAGRRPPAPSRPRRRRRRRRRRSAVRRAARPAARCHRASPTSHRGHHHPACVSPSPLPRRIAVTPRLRRATGRPANAHPDRPSPIYRPSDEPLSAATEAAAAGLVCRSPHRWQHVLGSPSSARFSCRSDGGACGRIPTSISSTGFSRLENRTVPISRRLTGAAS